jgi:hypothetical protein
MYFSPLELLFIVLILVIVLLAVRYGVLLYKSLKKEK